MNFCLQGIFRKDAFTSLFIGEGTILGRVGKKEESLSPERKASFVSTRKGKEEARFPTALSPRFEKRGSPIERKGGP